MHYNLACAFALLGDNDLAMERLERIMTPDALLSLKEFILHDSDLDKLRDDPRFIALLARNGISSAQ